MYIKQENRTKEAEKTSRLFEGEIAEDNRWVIMSKLIPWSEFEEEYAENFSKAGIGAPAKPFRIAIGALIIKEKLGTSDRETVEQIRENPYLQYFLGIEKYSNKAPFEASMLVHFRQRIGEETVTKINKRIVEKAMKQREEEEREKK